MNELFDLVKKNVESAQFEIENAVRTARRQIEDVSVMAVTKTHPVSYMEAALSAGLIHLGENRISEGGRKIKELGSDTAIFHAIGVLHRKEVRQASRDFHYLDAIHNVKIIEELARRNADNKILLEVNTSGEEAKQGFAPDLGILEETVNMVTESNLNLEGFLTVGPLGKGETEQRQAFSNLRELRDKLERLCGVQLPALSMGMSDDFVLAVLEGSTIVRLGRRLFGARS